MFNATELSVSCQFSYAGLDHAIRMLRARGEVPQMLVVGTKDFWWMIREGSRYGMFDLLHGMAVLHGPFDDALEFWAVMSADSVVYSELPF